MHFFQFSPIISHTSSCQQSYLEIHGLEDEISGWCKLDNLTAHQAQLLIVIQHSVHVLNPDGIHRTIKDQPFTIWGLEKNKNINLSSPLR